MSDLTPFPDGVGYLDHAWGGLSNTMRRALATARDADNSSRGIHSATRDALRGRSLLIAGLPWTLSERGRALIDWARETGRWTS